MRSPVLGGLRGEGAVRMRGQTLGSEHSLGAPGRAAQRESGVEGAPGSGGEGEDGATRQRAGRVSSPARKACEHGDGAGGEVPKFLQGYEEVEMYLKNWWQEQLKSRSDSWCSLLGACDQ